MVYEATPEDTQQDKREFETQGLGPIRQPPTINFDSIKKRWEILLAQQDGADYDDYIMVGEHKIIRYLERWVPPPKDVLLLGVGSGREVHAAIEHGYNAKGTTLGKKNPVFAKWKFGLDLFYGDHCACPYPSGSFDVIGGFQVFEHCHSPYIFLAEMCRLLRPGGLLILEWPPFIASPEGTATPNPGQQHSFMGDYNDDNLHHMCCWTPAQAWIMTRRCGFENVEVYGSGYPSGGRAIERTQGGLTRLEQDDPMFWSNLAPGDLVLKANRRPDSRLPDYMHQLIAT